MANQRIPSRRSFMILGRIVRSRFWFVYVLLSSLVGDGWSFVDDLYYLDSISVIEVENRSDSEVVSAELEVCAHQLQLGGLASGGTARMRFRVECVTGYDARFRLASGAALELTGVYITRGLGGIDRFIVEADRVVLEKFDISDAERDAANGE